MHGNMTLFLEAHGNWMHRLRGAAKHIEILFIYEIPVYTYCTSTLILS
jgi:hypothetical protein